MAAAAPLAPDHFSPVPRWPPGAALRMGMGPWQSCGLLSICTLVLAPEVLRTCASVPAVIEILVNSYTQLCVSESWKEVMPREAYQMHQSFYQSLFALANTPRCLQHLCRCSLRKLFGRKCFDLVPLLPLPKPLQNYLLLEPEGILH